MRFNTKWIAAPVFALLVSGVAVAQDPASSGTSNTQSTNTTQDPTIKQRKENQQDRIANGIQSGQLTAGEASKLETKEAAVNGEIKADRAANDGKLTPAEKAKINRQQNHLSKQIYDDKHNANTAHYGNNEVDQRRKNQQERIAQGVKSGQLTAGETAKLENQEKGINQQVKTDRAANGGKLTPGEKAQINKEQNQESKKIYNKKHNARTQAGTTPKK
jgi:hypothetical protein